MSGVGGGCGGDEREGVHRPATLATSLPFLHGEAERLQIRQ